MEGVQQGNAKDKGKEITPQFFLTKVFEKIRTLSISILLLKNANHLPPISGCKPSLQ